MALETNNTSKSYTRYNYGVNHLQHKGKTTTTSVGSVYDNFLMSLDGAPSRAGRVPAFCNERPDQISDIFYDTPGYWWYLLQYNSYFDPFETLSRGAIISIPELQ
tara:strand:+ start:494 stop:808 length:315 start_codon:yes stop_codon:yes gene_type:complete